LDRDAWRIDRAGSLHRLRRVSEPIAEPGPGEARVAVRAIGLNFADVFTSLGLYSATPKGSFVPGLEIAGVVDAMGPQRESGDDVACRPGAQVLAVTRFGAFATAVNVDVRYLTTLPEGWSFAQGAAFPVQALTAWYGLVHLARVQAGETVLVHSAAGGVGMNALAVLRSVRANVVATVGGPAKRDFLLTHEGLDASVVIVRSRRHFADQLEGALAALQARGVDVVFDAVAGPFFQPAYARLRPEGRYVIYGAADFMPSGSRPNYLMLVPRYLRRPRLDPLQLIAQNRSVIGFNLIWLWSEAERLGVAFQELNRIVRQPPYIGRMFPFAELPAALRWLQRGESIGKVVVSL
jgi:NADPH:quinone reductase-like Zn-dependent oxidoreductase